MTKCKQVLVLALLGAAALPAAAHAADLRGVFVGGFDTGGDKLLTVTFTDGTTDSIRANQGLYLGGGISVLNDTKDIEFQTTLAIKYDGVSASNGDATFTRIPLDALVFYRWERVRVGAGLTYVMSPKVKTSGIPPVDLNVTLDNAVGGLLQVDYLLGRVAIGLRYTALDYKFQGNTIKASGAGLTFSFTFGGG
jgi:hypothetical protein